MPWLLLSVDDFLLCVFIHNKCDYRQIWASVLRSRVLVCVHVHCAMGPNCCQCSSVHYNIIVNVYMYIILIWNMNRLKGGIV